MIKKSFLIFLTFITVFILALSGCSKNESTDGSDESQNKNSPSAPDVVSSATYYGKVTAVDGNKITMEKMNFGNGNMPGGGPNGGNFGGGFPNESGTDFSKGQGGMPSMPNGGSDGNGEMPSIPNGGSDGNVEMPSKPSGEFSDNMPSMPNDGNFNNMPEMPSEGFTPQNPGEDPTGLFDGVSPTDMMPFESFTDIKGGNQSGFLQSGETVTIEITDTSVLKDLTLEDIKTDMILKVVSDENGNITEISKQQ